jgi:tRNA nucleotidyltransferase (CCA-adding enzyme)
VGILESAGFETWAVGGAIRDASLGRPCGDWDLATRARPGDVQRLFRRTVPLGIEYGTVGVLAKSGALYEVTTFRRDVETFGRKAKVSFSDTIDEDLSRRDLTMNAVAWRPQTNELVDPFGGLGDLAAGRLRTVGAPGERFSEDYLRILRAMRFAGRFSLQMEAPLVSALNAGQAHLSALSPERVREELMKVLGADLHPSTALTHYRESGTLETLFPELVASSPDRWHQTLLVVDDLSIERPLLRLAALLQGGASQSDALLVRLRFSNADADRVSLLVRAREQPPGLSPPVEVSARRWLSRIGRDVLPDAARIWIATARADAVRGNACLADVAQAIQILRAEALASTALTVDALAVGGRDLMGIGIAPGPEIGSTLRRLLDAVIEDPSENQRERLLELARSGDMASDE